MRPVQRERGPRPARMRTHRMHDELPYPQGRGTSTSSCAGILQSQPFQLPPHAPLAASPSPVHAVAPSDLARVRGASVATGRQTLSSHRGRARRRPGLFTAGGGQARIIRPASLSFPTHPHHCLPAIASCPSSLISSARATLRTLRSPLSLRNTNLRPVVLTARAGRNVRGEECDGRSRGLQPMALIGARRCGMPCCVRPRQKEDCCCSARRGATREHHRPDSLLSLAP